MKTFLGIYCFVLTFIFGASIGCVGNQLGILHYGVSPATAAAVTELHEYKPVPCRCPCEQLEWSDDDGRTWHEGVCHCQRPCCCPPPCCRCSDCTLEVESTGEKLHAECFCPPPCCCPPRPKVHPNCRCNPCRCKDCDCFCPQCQPKEKGRCP